MKKFQSAAALAAAFAFQASAAHADTPSDQLQVREVEAAIQQLHANPKAFMNAPLTKYRVTKAGKRGEAVRETESAFSARKILDRSFVQERDIKRAEICSETNGVRTCVKDLLPGRSKALPGDLAIQFVDKPNLTDTLEGIEARHITSAAFFESPWSDTYWPIFRGALAARYADPSVPAGSSWKENRSYVESKPFDAIFALGDTAAINQLSPAEKYDLLVGSPGTLTNYMWGTGAMYAGPDGTGKVETWMGSCHGWAPASYMLKRPASTVTVTAADGRTMIDFYPSDIKGLATTLWANTATPTKFVGGRCNVKTPGTDANGRVEEQACFDNNPATWHLVVVNQIGRDPRRSFVIDATYDAEVWNQPMQGYQYTYFNPQTGKAGGSLKDNTVEISKFTNDKFKFDSKGKPRRARETRYVVGIAMVVNYVVETAASTARTNDKTSDRLRQVRYLYDLELDASRKIIGGEWYTNLHPDFLWTPPVGARAVSLGDELISGTWDGKGPVPLDWRSAAERAAEKGQPLAAIVEQLIKVSRGALKNP